MPLKAIFIKQTTSMTLKGEEDPCTVKTFSYDIAKSGFHQRILFDVQIPLPENAQANDYLGHLIDRHNVPLFAHKEVANALEEFIWRETHQFMAAQADKQIQSGLDGDGLDNFAKQAFHLLEHDDESAVRKQFDAQSLDDTTTFEEHFQSVMRNCDFRQLSRLIGEEVKMSEEMRSLVQTRDSELSRLEKLCEVNLASSPKDAEKLDQHSQGISELNTQIRNVSADFSRQIETLLQKQRRHYRMLVQKLAQNESIDGKATELSTNDRQKPSTLLTSSHSHSAGFADDSSSRTEKGGSKTKFKKSMSCDERMSSLANLSTNYSESFSIYIGSQLKTMHNARILSCASLADLCLSQQDELHGSNRLHLLMSLYGRELSALVLIVGRDPRWHIRNRTRFAQLCEQGTELHFDRLETQLAKIEEQVRKANQSRRRRRQFVDLSQLSYSPPLEFYDSSADDGWLHTGDVYITRHSNLSAVQLVFHLVADTALGQEEVTSRHPCIGGLRNIVRLSARSAVRNISLPLLLVDGLKEELATNHSWCLGRAELVYKCLKGFLMEVCSSGGSNASMASGNSAAPAGSSQSLHFNINFALPSAVPGPLFRQLVDLFANIYYLVPSLNA